jgi:hypothetical protein
MRPTATLVALGNLAALVSHSEPTFGDLVELIPEIVFRMRVSSGGARLEYVSAASQTVVG